MVCASNKLNILRRLLVLLHSFPASCTSAILLKTAPGVFLVVLFYYYCSGYEFTRAQTTDQIMHINDADNGRHAPHPSFA